MHKVGLVELSARATVIFLQIFLSIEISSNLQDNPTNFKKNYVILAHFYQAKQLENKWGRSIVDTAALKVEKTTYK